MVECLIIGNTYNAYKLLGNIHVQSITAEFVKNDGSLINNGLLH